MNIYDIAKEAGVSISTVSRVINNTQNVSKERRERVLDVLKKHNYVPSGVARSLANKTTKTIAVMLVDVRHTHYANISYTIEQMMTENGYRVIICNTGYTKEKMNQYMKILAETQVDGIIMVGSIYNNHMIYHSIKTYFSRIPIVMHNAKMTRENIYNIDSNGNLGIKKAIDYLIEKNYKKIVFVQDSNTSVAHSKVKAYMDKMKEYKIDISEQNIVKVESGIDGGVEAIKTMESLKLNYDAIIGCEDITCIGILDQLKKSGKTVPHDVGIIGFNNSIYSMVSNPPLTTVDSKHEKIAIKLSQTMIGVLRGKKEPHHIDIYPELVIRETT